MVTTSDTKPGSERVVPPGSEQVVPPGSAHGTKPKVEIWRRTAAKLISRLSRFGPPPPPSPSPTRGGGGEGGPATPAAAFDTPAIQPSANEVVEPSGDLTKFAKALKLRARLVDLWALVILGGIILLLMIGALVFIYAAQIAQEDLRSEFQRRLDSLAAEQKVTEEKQLGAYKSIAQSVKNILSECATTYSTPKNSGQAGGGTYRDYVDLLENTQSKELPFDIFIFREGEGLHLDVNTRGSCSAKISDLAKTQGVAAALDEYHHTSNKLNRIEISKTQVEEAMIKRLSVNYEQQDSKQTSDNMSDNPKVQEQPPAKTAVTTTVSNPWVILIQTNITRFGTLVLLIFLVSILIPLYRYNARLAAFYRARADTLNSGDDPCN
jgi:hypothetical protein